MSSTLVTEFLTRSAMAVLCGGLIGIERELKKKPAGFRTNILICLGSTYFMMVSQLVSGPDGLQLGDPGRIAAQVVTGIGFIGAGTIIQSRGQIAGLTTAALIWVVAAVGLLIGSGHLTVAGLGTLMIFLTLTLLGLLERRVLARCRFFEAQIVFADDGGKTKRDIARLLASREQPLEEMDCKKSNGYLTMSLPYCDVHPEHRRILKDLWLIDGVQEVRPLR
jgi:putative Mg2+ transporter-C (MgtC) family protein